MNPNAKCLSENYSSTPVILIVRTEGREAADVANFCMMIAEVVSLNFDSEAAQA